MTELLDRSFVLAGSQTLESFGLSSGKFLYGYPALKDVLYVREAGKNLMSSYIHAGIFQGKRHIFSGLKTPSVQALQSNFPVLGRT
jgi:hypothetical protein